MKLDERVHHVLVSEETLQVHLVDGRTISVPLAWYPRLLHAGAEQRANWHLLAPGDTISWPELDEIIGTEELLWKGPANHEKNKELEQAIRQMAEDEMYEAEALEWAEATIGDVGSLSEEAYEVDDPYWADVEFSTRPWQTS
jgi:hypothetical protein